MPPEVIVEESVAGLPPEESRILILDVDGYVVTIGQNGLANDRMVREHQRKHPHCLWLHALRAIGSHLICCIEGKGQVPYATFKQVGKLAIEYSRSRFTAVRFATLENVFKPEAMEGKSNVGTWLARNYRIFDI